MNDPETPVNGSGKRKLRTIDPKFRFLKPGVLIFKPTVAERAKLALGYCIRVDVLMKFQHNPGITAVRSAWRPTEQLPSDDMKLPESPEKKEDGS
jgi:hypothetical protein